MPKVYDKLTDSMVDPDDLEGSTPADVMNIIKFLEKPENAKKVELLELEREQIYGTHEEKTNKRVVA